MPYCKFCIYSDLYKRDNYGYVLCKLDGRYFYKPDDMNHCGDYDGGTSKWYNDEDELNKANEYLEKYSNKNNYCFITTTVCDILNFNDSCTTLQTLRYLRDTYMIKNKDYHNLLIEYHALGPIISNNLLNEKDKIAFAKNLYDNYLYPSAILISKGNYDDAINNYCDMVDTLKTRYDLHDIKIDYDSSQLIESKKDLKKLSFKIYK